VIAATRVAVVAALGYFLLGNLLGLLLGLGVAPYAWRPAHAHLNLLGFVAMMIYGVAYHALPRFAGVPLRRPGLALAQVVLANVALLGLTLGWGLGWPPAAFGLWGALQLVAACLFVGLTADLLLRRPYAG
jgi:hypothetical protein